MSDEVEINEYEVECDDGPKLRFKGVRLGGASSYHYSNNSTRWTVIRLFKTVGGKYVCEKIGETRWQGERTRYSAKVCDNLDEVKQFFGYGWLAKELYDEAGIDAAEIIE